MGVAGVQTCATAFEVCGIRDALGVLAIDVKSYESPFDAHFELIRAGALSNSARGRPRDQRRFRSALVQHHLVLRAIAAVDQESVVLELVIFRSLAVNHEAVSGRWRDAVDTARRDAHGRILGVVIVARAIHRNEDLILRAHVVFVIRVGQIAELRTPRAPLLFGEIVTKRGRQVGSGVRIRPRGVCVVRIRRFQVRVTICVYVDQAIAIRLRTHTGDSQKYYDDANAQYYNYGECTKNPPYRI